jgi:hypothetical protein
MRMRQVRTFLVFDFQVLEIKEKNPICVMQRHTSAEPLPISHDKELQRCEIHHAH